MVQSHRFFFLFWRISCDKYRFLCSQERIASLSLQRDHTEFSNDYYESKRYGNGDLEGLDIRRVYSKEEEVFRKDHHFDFLLLEIKDILDPFLKNRVNQFGSF